MSKRKKVALIALILILIVLAFICGNVYAKYIAQISGSVKGEIAKWSFKVNGATEQFTTINLASNYNDNNLSGNKLAPGATGDFCLVIDASDSDVGINYSVNFEEISNKPTNLKFVYNNTFYDSLEELQGKITGTIQANDQNKIIEIPINWIWGYETGANQSEIEQNDIIDTQEGEEMSNYSFNVNVIGTQIQP